MANSDEQYPCQVLVYFITQVHRNWESSVLAAALVEFDEAVPSLVPPFHPQVLSPSPPVLFQMSEPTVGTRRRTNLDKQRGHCQTRDVPMIRALDNPQSPADQLAKDLAHNLHQSVSHIPFCLWQQ